MPERSLSACQRTSPLARFFCYHREKRGVRLGNWRKNSRRDIVMVDVDALVPKDHLLRKIENVMDYEWLYARLSPYYCADNGRPGSDPVVLIKMVLLQHLYG